MGPVPDKEPKPFEILQKVFDMIKYAYLALAQFPKSEKYALATDIKRTMDEVLGYCIEVQKRKSKKTTLTNLDIANTKLKVYIRLAFDLKFLPIKKYEIWAAQVVEIGKMIGGLIKADKEADNHRE